MRVVEVRRRGVGQWLALAVLLCAVALAQLGCSLLGPKIDKLTMLVTGNQLAYVKNCGCASGQTGGLLRQMRVMRQEHEAALTSSGGAKLASEAVLLELGNFSDPSTPVKHIESEMVVTALADLNYSSVGIGGKELNWPQVELLELLINKGLPLTCCNLSFTAPKPSISLDMSKELNGIFKPYQLIKTRSGFTVGIIHAIQSGKVLELGGMYGYTLDRPADAVARVLDAHAKEADYWILTLANADDLGSTAGGLEKESRLDAVIGFNFDNPLTGTGTSAVRPIFIDPPFHKAKDLTKAIQYFNPDGKPGVLSTESLALRADIKGDEKLSGLWEGMQVKLQKLATDEANGLIKARANAKPPFHVGQNNCVECHKEIVDKMATTKHNRAYVTLVEKGVETNASCVKCHVVGYGAPWGWNVKENQPNLQGVQCENCHGPASYHLDLYKKKAPPADLLADGRDKFGLHPAGEATCVKCHDVDNSPPEGFSFSTYWEKIKH